MQKVAIIGAGLGGLGASFFLTMLGCRVTVFDDQGIGGGASGIAAGLVHPYVGENCKRSLWAREAFLETQKLAQSIPGAILEEGVLRIASPTQEPILMRHAEEFQDITPLGGGVFRIDAALVIDTKRYLQGLYECCEALGAIFVKTRITNLEELSTFDQVLVAVGHEMGFFFPEKQSLISRVKGQLFDVRLEKEEKTQIAKGYLVKGKGDLLYHFGATYERDFIGIEPDEKKALSLLKKETFASLERATFLSIKSGVRLVRRGSYVPYIERINDKTWWIGAFGSRGLLYHAFLGRKLAEAMVNSDISLIPDLCSVVGRAR